MGDESWRIERIDEDWADLRQGDYVYCVPVSELPQDVQEGDSLRAPNASGSGATNWVSEGPRVRTA